MTCQTIAKPFEAITKAEFTAYERIRQSGMVNMFDRRVCDLADFDRATHVAILTHYKALATKWPEVRESKLW